MDLRLVPVAAAVWSGAVLGVATRGPVAVALAAGLALVAAVPIGRRTTRGRRERRGHPARAPAGGPPETDSGGTSDRAPATVAGGARATVAILVLVCAAAVLVGAVAEHRRVTGPVAGLAASGTAATITVSGSVRSVPRRLAGGAPGTVLVRLRVEAVQRAGGWVADDAQVSVLAGPAWAALRPGSTVTSALRLRPRRRVSADAASAVAREPPTVLAGPGGVGALAGSVRRGLARVSAPLGQPAAGLLPAVVYGDTSGIAPELAERFRVSGLAHLEAVSGANVAVVVLAATGTAVALGAGRLVSGVVGVGAVAGFAVLADLSPPVVRAGATAVLVLLGTRRGPGRGPALLATAVVVLLLADPWLAVDAGFGLSVAATVGILAGANRFAGALATWLPRRVAMGAGIGLAAQAACQPLLTVISGQVGLVAPFTNIAAEPAVGIATLSGVVAAVLASVPLPGPAGAVLMAGAGLAAQVGGAACRWLAWVAATGARAPGATADWAATPTGIAAACGWAVLVLAVGPAVLRRRRLALTAAGVLAGLVLGPVVLG